MLLQGAEELPQLRLSNFRPGWTPLAPGARQHKHLQKYKYIQYKC